MFIFLGLFADESSSSKVLIATMSIEDGYQQIYLQAGTYLFKIYAWVTTDDPFDPWTDYYWMNYAEIEGDIWQSYYAVSWECNNVLFTQNSIYFGVQTSGYYDVKAGAYECYGNVTVNSNLAELYRTALNSGE